MRIRPRPVRRRPVDTLAQGKHIYAYRHVRTNQVLYSLTRILDNKDALKQLPDVGANNKPMSLRKDSWKPFFTVSMAEHPNAKEQGLALYTRLRDWRIIHETSWKPPTFFSRKYTPQEIEKLEESIERRGGSKKESVYKAIKHQQHKLRARLVMNQTANSVADLAAVLMQQEPKRDSAIRTKWLFRSKEFREMQALGEQTAQGGLEKTMQAIESLRILRKQPKNQKDTLEARQQLNHRIDVLEFTKRRILFACRTLTREKKWRSILRPLPIARLSKFEDPREQGDLLQQRLASFTELNSQSKRFSDSAVGKMGEYLETVINEPSPFAQVGLQLTRLVSHVMSTREEREEVAHAILQSPESPKVAKNSVELLEKQLSEQSLLREQLPESQKDSVQRWAHREVVTPSTTEEAKGESEQLQEKRRQEAKREKAELAAETLDIKATNSEFEKQQFAVQHLTKPSAEFPRRLPVLDAELESTLQAYHCFRGFIDHCIDSEPQDDVGVSLRLAFYDLADKEKSYSIEEINGSKDAELLSSEDPIPTERLLGEEIKQITLPRNEIGESIDVANELPYFPTRLASNSLRKIGEKKEVYEQRMLRNSRLTNPQIYSVHGLRIQWANPLDAEFAESWPAAITHEPMGYSRHAAPEASKPTNLTVPLHDYEALEAKRLSKPVKMQRWKPKSNLRQRSQAQLLEEIAHKLMAPPVARKSPTDAMTKAINA